MNIKSKDIYERFFGGGKDNQDLFCAEIRESDENSKWTEITINQCELVDLGLPMERMTNDVGKLYHLDEELVEDTAENGTRLMLLGEGIPFLVRRAALPSIFQTAKLNGSALGKMDPLRLAQTINNGFAVGSGKALALERYGKLSACHSAGEGGYAIMPIPELCDIAIKELEEKFGYIEMDNAYHSHEYSRATWQLVDAQSAMMSKYQSVLQKYMEQEHIPMYMPAARFSSSDTANSCATLEPVFLTNEGSELRFTAGVSIKHKRAPAGELQPMDAFQQGCKELFAKFDESIEMMEELAKREVYHAENFVISVCKKLKIAKKYGEAARDYAECLAAGRAYVDGHSMYLAMTNIISSAKEYGASGRTLLELDEKISQIPTLDWAEHDVGGTVAWSDK